MKAVVAKALADAPTRAPSPAMDAHGAVVIAAITSCTNTSNPAA
jgi:aconitase A